MGESRKEGLALNASWFCPVRSSHFPPSANACRALEGNASFLFVRDNERATISDPSSLGQKAAAAAAEGRREEAEAENLFLLFTPSARCCWTAIYKGLQCIPFVRTTCTIRSFSILVQCSGGPNSRASSVSPKARRTVAKFASPTLPVMHRSCSKGCTMIPESGSGLAVLLFQPEVKCRSSASSDRRRRPRHFPRKRNAKCNAK